MKYTVEVVIRPDGQTQAHVCCGKERWTSGAMQPDDELAFRVGREIVAHARGSAKPDPADTVASALLAVESHKRQLTEAERRLATAQYAERVKGAVTV